MPWRRKHPIVAALVDWRFVLSIALAAAFVVMVGLIYSLEVNVRTAVQHADDTASRSFTRINALQATNANLAQELAEILAAQGNPASVQEAVKRAAVRQAELQVAPVPGVAVPASTDTGTSSTTGVPETTTTTGTTSTTTQPPPCMTVPMVAASIPFCITH